MRNYLYILLVAIGLLGMISCEKSVDEAKINAEGECANLSISLNSPTFQVSTRSLATDPKNQGDSWTTWEKFVDGALLYRVSIFVVDSDNKLAAYRNFYFDSDDINDDNGFYETNTVNTYATTGVAVKATFDSSSPLHEGEKLKAGDYKIYAIANFAPITDDDTALFADDETVTTYSGLGLEEEDGTSNNNGVSGDFTTLVNNIITAGIGYDFTGSDGQALLNYTLNSGDDRICKQVPQPLVMIRNVTLDNGENDASGTLSRTFARIRLEVKNNDSSSMIGVSALSFQDNYASQKAYLFNDVTAGDVNMHGNFDLYEDSKGAIGVTSTDAITPASSTMKRLPAGITNTILDCYILEGMISAEFAFEFEATHWTSGTSGSATANYRITSFYANESSGSGGGGSGEYGLLDFMIYIRDSSGSSSQYLLGSETENQYSQSGTVEVSQTDANEGDVIAPKYVWEITLSETPTYSSQRGVAKGVLQNLASGLFLQPYDGSSDMTPKLGDTQGELIYKINFGSEVENGTILSYYDGKYYYLYSDSSHNLKWSEYSETSITTSSSPTYEYLAFETIPGEAGKAETITIQKSITNSSTAGVTTNEIVRNDFFYGVIPLSISESSASATE